MKKSLIYLCFLAVFAALPPAAGAAGSTWEVDPQHSNIGFRVEHLQMTWVPGEFLRYRATVEIDEEDVTRSKVEAAIEVASVDTDVAKRDDHLRSPDFFDAAAHPEMTFRSRKVAVAGEGRLEVTGDLAFHGASREVTLIVEGPTAPRRDPWGGVRRGASARATIDRRDWGLSWNAPLEGGGEVLGNTVEIVIDVEMIRK